MKIIFFSKRFTLLKTYIKVFITLSFIIRLVLLIWVFNEADTSFINLIKTFLIGFLFDIGTISFFAIPYVIYLLVIPKKLYGSLFDRIVTYFAYSLGLLIFMFSFFAEITFWEEFKHRFNFIAVDYLVYTHEVVKNINESYPMPLLIGLMLFVVGVLIFYTKKKNYFYDTFNNETSLKKKLTPSLLVFIIAVIFGVFITNKNAEFSNNRYNNEIAKTGIYSFFAAFRNNELSYTEFYNTINQDKAIAEVKSRLEITDNNFIGNDKNFILRKINNNDSLQQPITPNVIFICIESLNAKYLSYFGNQPSITPNLDSLAKNSLFFTNLYATGTRTVRGMEAITLSIPSTPGRSIVKRENNIGLFTISNVFKQKGYESTFFYGGDGYFDNMNTYFGGNGFNIVDRGRGFLLDESIKTKRTNIEDNEVIFENAWGVCDGDIYNKVLKEADKASKANQHFFNFIMTTSNHRPFTYPDNKIDIPSGTNRSGAIKYTDYAIGEFLKKAKTKAWYKNTIFVIMSDHCAYSAGRLEINVKNYHIPAMIFNAPNLEPKKIDKLSSQIDLFPTLFALLNWDYTSNLFGKNILTMKLQEERAFIGNYRKLGLLKKDKLIILSEQKKAIDYEWDKADNSLNPVSIDNSFLEETTSYYQVADYLFHHNGLKIKE